MRGHLLFLLLGACTIIEDSSDEAPHGPLPQWKLPPTVCAPGTMPGDCRAAGLPSWPCPAGSIPDGGGCKAPGVPDGGCGAGFVSDKKGGCDAVLPDKPCAAGQLALPGETTCHALAACGRGPWGDVPVDAATVYVDAAYPGKDSDGSAQKPFKTIAAAVAKAASGGLVVIAAGSYGESLALAKPVRLYGRCPELVGVSAPKTDVAIDLTAGASGSEVKSIAVRGNSLGIRAAGAKLAIDRVWLDHPGWTAIEANAGAEVTVTNTLVDGPTALGARAHGASLTLSSSVIRQVALAPDGNGGNGVLAQIDATPAKLTVDKSVIADTHGVGIYAVGATASVSDTLVSGVAAIATGAGYGVMALNDPTSKTASDLTLARSVVEKSALAGVWLRDSNGHVDATVVRDVAVGDGKAKGAGLWFRRGAAGSTAVTLDVARSLVDTVPWRGLEIGAGNATVTSTIVRGVSVPEGETNGRGVLAYTYAAADPLTTVKLSGVDIENATECAVCAFGAKVDIGYAALRQIKRGTLATGSGAGVITLPREGIRTALAVHDALVEQTANAGLLLKGSDVELDSLWVRDIGYDADLSLGISALADETSGEISNVHVSRSVVERTSLLGVILKGGSLKAESLIVRDISPSPVNGKGGRGLEVDVGEPTPHAPGSLELRGSIIEKVSEIGVLALGTTATIDGVVVRDVAAAAGTFGDGISLQIDLERSIAAGGSIHNVLVERSHQAGIAVLGAVATVDLAEVRETMANDGRFGDGLLVIAPWNKATGVPFETRATVSNTRVSASARAGVGNFGGRVELGATQLECNGIQLAGEHNGPVDYAFQDLGDNACGCDAQSTACQVLSSNLEPPPPLTSGS